eukprot:6926314-Alexandrium_andersonii.AAC.1
MAAPAVGLTAAAGQNVIRVRAHDGPAKNARGSLGEVRSRRAGRRAWMWVAQTKVAVGRRP